MNPLRLTLKCPVCFLVRRGDVFVCKKGHSVCGSCLTRLPAAPAKLCPLARCGFDDPPRHNLMAEQTNSVAITCKNADKGVGEELEEHKPECPQRVVPCPWTHCQVRPLGAGLLRLSELERHIATSPDHLVEEGGWCFYTYARIAGWGPTLQQIDGKTFYGQVVEREGTWYAWVKVVSGAREVAGWTCDVTAGGGDMAARNLPVHPIGPIDRTVEEILGSGQYLALLKQQARNIAEPDFGIYVEYEIKMK